MDRPGKLFCVRVDYENNAEQFWDVFFEVFPHLNYHDDTFYLTEDEVEIMRNLPGYKDSCSPNYAPHPVIIDEATLD